MSVCAEIGGYLTSSSAITTILSAVTEFVTSAISWIGSFTTAITSNGLLLIFVIVAFVGLGVGLISRIIRL